MVPLIFNFLNSLGFGGLFLAGIFGLLYLFFPDFLSPYIRIEYFVIFGGLIGASVHRILHWLVINFLYPFSKFGIYYTKLLELQFQLKKELISTEQYNLIKSQLDVIYFLDNNIPPPPDVIDLSKIVDKNGRFALKGNEEE